MDTSKEYIEKCVKATEIQGQSRELKHFHRLKDIEGIVFDDENVWFAELICGKLRQIWLPRQDQLQEMLSDDINKLTIIIWKDLSWLHKERSVADLPMYIIGLKSLEQYWLVLVMKEKYHKQWNSKKKEWLIDIKK